MRAAIRRVWLRFSYARPVLDDREIARGVTRGTMRQRAPAGEKMRATTARLADLIDDGAADALDTIMMALYGRLLARRDGDGSSSSALSPMIRAEMAGNVGSAGGAPLIEEQT